MIHRPLPTKGAEDSYCHVLSLHLFAASQTLRTVSIRCTGISTPGLRGPDPSIPPPQQGCGLCSLRGCHATESHTWTCGVVTQWQNIYWRTTWRSVMRMICQTPMSRHVNHVVVRMLSYPEPSNPVGGSYIFTSVFVHTQNPTDLGFWSSNKAFSKQNKGPQVGHPSPLTFPGWWQEVDSCLSNPSNF